MIRRLHLHIGTMKSATSSIQRAFAENAERLLEDDVWWIPADLRYESIRDLLGRPMQAPGHPAWTLLERGLRMRDGEAVLSNELLAGLATPKVARVVAALPVEDIRVVVTARSLTRVIPSHWQETIKLGRTWTWRDFAAQVCSDQPPENTSAAGAERDAGRWFWHRQDIPAIVARWSAVLPIDHITVVTVPSASPATGVAVERFAAACHLRTSGWGNQVQPANSSLGAHSAELMRRVNAELTAIADRDPDRRYRRALSAALATGSDSEPRFDLSAEQLEWIRARTHTMTSAIADSGALLVGDLDDLTPAPTRHSSMDPADTTDAQLVAGAIRGFDALLDGFVRARSQSEALRRRLTVEETARRDAEDRLVASSISTRESPESTAQTSRSPARIRSLSGLAKRVRTRRRGSEDSPSEPQ